MTNLPVAQPRRLLQVVRSLRAETGGVAAAVQNLNAELQARGIAVQTLSLDPADAVRPDVVALDGGARGYGYTAEFAPWLRAHQREFDAVVVHGLWQYPGFGAWRALHGSGTPYLVMCHGMLDPWFKRTYPLKHAKKWLYWPWAEYRVLRDAAGVLFTCEEERRLARESFWLYRAREYVAPLGVPEPPAVDAVQTAAFRAIAPGLGTRSYLLFLGRIHVKKGIEQLLDGYAVARGASAQVPALVVAGPCTDGAYVERLRVRAQQLGLGGDVHWLPMLAGAAKWGALRGCEAFVLPSHQENFGIAVVEALACGRPVLISDQVNVWREITDDGAGWAGPDTAAAVTALLARWLACPPGDRERMGAAARACYERRFSPGPATERFLEVIQEALAGSTPPMSPATIPGAP